MAPSLDQERAAYAWECVTEAGGIDEYKTLAKGAPSLIMANGLMQALAFYQSKGRGGRKGDKNQHDRLREHICAWLQKRRLLESKRFANVMRYLSTISSEGYLNATEEALEILRWIRRFADAYAKGD